MRKTSISSGVVFWLIVLAILLGLLMALSILRTTYFDYVLTLVKPITGSKVQRIMILYGSFIVVMFLPFYSLGWFAFRKAFINQMRGEELKRLGNYVLVPFREDIRAHREFEETHFTTRSEWVDRHLLLFPQKEIGLSNSPFRNSWLGLCWSLYGRAITNLRILIALLIIISASLPLKDYLFGRIAEFTDNVLLYLLVDAIQLGCILTTSYLLGREAIKSRIRCGGNEGLTVIGSYLCVKLNTEPYIVICSRWKLGGSLKEDAAETYAHYQTFLGKELADEQWADSL